MTRPSYRRTPDPASLYSRLYRRAAELIQGGRPQPWCACPHGWLIGYVLRPGTGTPSCAQCRRIPACWATPDDAAESIRGSAFTSPPPDRLAPLAGLFE